MDEDYLLILGASSPIAKSTAKQFASQGFNLYLGGRDIKELERIANDMKIRYPVAIKWGFFDATRFDEHELFLQKVVSESGHLNGLFISFGELGSQKKGEEAFPEAMRIIDTNYMGAVSILTHAANYFEQAKKGFIIAISSVAADRGKKSNYIYGSAKAGLNVFLEGLRHRLYDSGIRVITIKPGFVDTPMTYGKEGLFFTADPESIGKQIASSLNQKSDILYLPGFWRYVMKLIGFIPESLFKRLNL